MHWLRSYLLPSALLGWLVVALSLGAAGMRASVTQARDTWEYDRYQVRLWLAARPSARFPAPLQAEVIGQLQKEMPLFAGVTWRLVVERAPQAVSATLATRLDSVTAERILELGDKVLSQDKLVMLAVEPRNGGYRMACREFDCRARSLSATVRGRTLQRRRLGRDCARLAARAFSPLARVEQSRGQGAGVRVRAGGLVNADHSVSRVKEGDVFRAVIRRNDREGNPRPEGIEEVDWTYLRVRERGRQQHVWDCDVLSALRNPLAGRSSARIKKLALGVSPVGKSTRLKLVAKREESRPLQGYEIFAKKPLPSEAEEPNSAQRLGLTDRRGIIQVPPGDMPLRLLYVKNGTHLIARLPVVPGLSPQLTAPLPSDDRRLEAEAFVKGMEATVMDLVARREILGKRIERRVNQGKIEEARQLLEELKSFRTQDDLEVLLTDRQRTVFSSAQAREQQRIDRMLSGTRILINQYLDPDQLVTLQRLVEDAAE